jgi:UDP-N-acetylmuramate--alanine ligase
VLDSIESVAITYGLGEGASLRGINLRLGDKVSTENLAARIASATTCVDVVCEDDRIGHEGLLGTLEVRCLGENNVRNALAACTVGLCLGLPFSVIRDGLRQFDGVERRLEVRGESNGITVVEDYAHHPTEIKSTLEAIRWMEPGRVVCVFQPHLYSRTKFFYAEFAEILGEFDIAIVTEIYASREDAIPGVDAGLIVEHARKSGDDHVVLVSEMDDVPGGLIPQLEKGDVVLVLGAGDVNRIVPTLLERLADA